MDYQYLYNLGNLLDFEGKYDESDIVFDSMMRLAAPDGRGRTQGRPRPRDLNPRLTPEQIRARLNPQVPVTPQQPATPVNTQQQARVPRKFYNVRDPKTGRFM